MKLWSDFYDYLLPDLPGCVPGMADIALRRAAQQFCERTLVWKEYLYAQALTMNVMEYPFGIPSTQEMVKLLDATINYVDDSDPENPVNCVDDLPVFRLDQLPHDWKTRQRLPPGIMTLDRVSYYVFPVITPPQAADDAPLPARSVVAHVALKPSNTGTGVDDNTFAHHVHKIASGAKAILMMSPKKPYTDANLAQYHQGVFDDACATVGVMAGQSFSATARRARVKTF